jgi:nicotinamidase-related amidase
MSKFRSKQSTVLVIIDPQNDFMDIEGAALPVPGATADMARLSGFIRRESRHIDEILVTLDTHSPMHIAHAVRWIDKAGYHPQPFTQITLESVKDGTYRAADPEKQVWQHAYVRALHHGRGNKPLMIWPPHCIRDTKGHQVVVSLKRELDSWSESSRTSVKYLHKGTNSDTEQYGAFGPEVGIPGVVETENNTRILEWLTLFNRQVWAGEALSHCLMTSFDQATFPNEAMESMTKRIILTDAMSPVTGFEAVAKDWLALKKAAGVRLATTTDFSLAH